MSGQELSQIPTSTNRGEDEDEIEIVSSMKDIEDHFKKTDQEITALKKQVQDHLLDKIRLQKAFSEKIKALKMELCHEKAQNQVLAKQIEFLQGEITNNSNADQGAKEKLLKLEKLANVFHESVLRVLK